MRSQAPLSNYLTRMAIEGRFDSSGSFTVLETEALKKLSRFTLPIKEEWVLKIVQAAVARKAEKLDFKICRSAIEVRFDFPGGAEWEDIAHTISDVTRLPGVFAGPMNIALRTLLSHHRFRLFSGTGHDLYWDGRRLQRGELEGIVKVLTLIVERRQLGAKASWFDSAVTKDALAYEHILKRRACYAPLKLFLDGRGLSPSIVPASLRAPGSHPGRMTSVLQARLYPEDGFAAAARPDNTSADRREFSRRLVLIGNKGSAL